MLTNKLPADCGGFWLTRQQVPIMTAPAVYRNMGCCPISATRVNTSGLIQWQKLRG